MHTNTDVTQADGGIWYGYCEPRNEVISGYEEVTKSVGDKDEDG